MFQRNVPRSGDALTLLRTLPDSCTPLLFFDPQHRDVLNKLKFGNEGARQKGRAQLPAMTSDYVDMCCREAARVLRPSGYLLQWVDTFRLCEAYHLRIADVFKCVDLIAWDNLRPSMGKRSRRRGTICWSCSGHRWSQTAPGETAAFQAGGRKRSTARSIHTSSRSG
jgi:site-specific DNA-methyltransferase (adenine-specific)